MVSYNEYKWPVFLWVLFISIAFEDPERVIMISSLVSILSSFIPEASIPESDTFCFFFEKRIQEIEDALFNDTLVLNMWNTVFLYFLFLILTQIYRFTLIKHSFINSFYLSIFSLLYFQYRYALIQALIFLPHK